MVILFQTISFKSDLLEFEGEFFYEAAVLIIFFLEDGHVFLLALAGVLG